MNKDTSLSVFENVEDSVTIGMLKQAQKIAEHKEWKKIQAEREQNNQQFVSTKSIFDDNDTVEIPQFLEETTETKTEQIATSVTEAQTEQPQAETSDSMPWWWFVICGIGLLICKCFLK